MYILIYILSMIFQCLILSKKNTLSQICFPLSENKCSSPTLMRSFLDSYQSKQVESFYENIKETLKIPFIIFGEYGETFMKLFLYVCSCLDGMRVGMLI